MVYSSPYLPNGRPQDEKLSVCNLYSMTRSQEAIAGSSPASGPRRQHTAAARNYPDYPAPIIRNAGEGRELVMARWGIQRRLSTSPARQVDRGVTNIRQTSSSHWRPWLGPEHRCLVPFTSFAENETQPDGSKPPVWFAFDEAARSPSSPAYGRAGPACGR